MCWGSFSDGVKLVSMSAFYDITSCGYECESPRKSLYVDLDFIQLVLLKARTFSAKINFCAPLF